MNTKPLGRWSGVVAIVGSTVACGGIYDMGTGTTAGAGGEGGAESALPTGGSGTAETGGSGLEPGPSGAGAGLGSAGSPDSGTGGSAASSSGTGGAGTAGGSGGAGCPSAWDGFPEGPLASSEVIDERLTKLIFGEVLHFPVELDRSNVREEARSRIEVLSTVVAPPGLREFVQGWAFDGVEDAEDAEAAASHWASEFFMHAGSFAKLFAPFGDTAERRASFLSEPALLSAHPSIAKRGVFALDRVLCIGPLGAPPAGHPTVEVGAGQTTRQAYEATSPTTPACVGCHHYVDSLGFSLEHFDSVGAYRDSENSLPIDASGSFEDSRGNVEFTDIVELAAWMGESPDVASCLSRWFFRYAREEVAGKPGIELSNAEAEAVACEFVSRGYEPLSLLEAVVDTPSFLLE